MAKVLACLAVLIFMAVPAGAVQPDEILDDPALEERARAISQQLRCLVCQNESIDSSNAEVARDLRNVVRERLVAGNTDEQIIDFVVGRYGDFVLLSPPFRSRTVLLWVAPILMFMIGGLLIFAFYRNMSQSRSEDSTLSTEEEEKLKRYLEGR